MKKLYIPKGETRCYQSLETEHAIVNGCLKVETTIKCRHITGKGVIEAGLISSDTVTASDLEAAEIVARKLLAQRICACEVHAAESMAVSSYLSAQLVEAGRLTVAMSEIGELRCGDVVNLSAKRRRLLGTLLGSFLRSVWTAITCRVPREPQVMDAGWKPVGEPQKAPASQPDPASKPDTPKDQVGVDRFADLADDFEFMRLAGTYRLLKQDGFYLRLIPMEKPAVPAAPPEAVDEASSPAA